jgi:hypothetical protein
MRWHRTEPSGPPSPTAPAERQSATELAPYPPQNRGARHAGRAQRLHDRHEERLPLPAVALPTKIRRSLLGVCGFTVGAIGVAKGLFPVVYSESERAERPFSL